MTPHFRPRFATHRATAAPPRHRCGLAIDSVYIHAVRREAAPGQSVVLAVCGHPLLGSRAAYAQGRSFAEAWRRGATCCPRCASALRLDASDYGSAIGGHTSSRRALLLRGLLGGALAFAPLAVALATRRRGASMRA